MQQILTKNQSHFFWVPVGISVLKLKALLNRLATLPTELALLVLYFLDPLDAHSLAACSRTLLHLTNDKPYWARLATKCYVQIHGCLIRSVDDSREDCSLMVSYVKSVHLHELGTRVWYDLRDRLFWKNPEWKYNLRDPASERLLEWAQEVLCSLLTGTQIDTTFFPLSLDGHLMASLRVHNGQLSDVAPGQGLLYGCRLLSVQEIVRQRKLVYDRWHKDPSFPKITTSVGRSHSVLGLPISADSQEIKSPSKRKPSGRSELKQVDYGSTMELECELMAVTNKSGSTWLGIASDGCVHAVTGLSKVRQAETWLHFLSHFNRPTFQPFF